MRRYKERADNENNHPTLFASYSGAQQKQLLVGVISTAWEISQNNVKEIFGQALNNMSNKLKNNL